VPVAACKPISGDTRRSQIHVRDRPICYLLAEGVEVTEGRTGELRVDLKRFGWFPSVDEVRMLLGDGHEEEGDDDSEGHS